MRAPRLILAVVAVVSLVGMMYVLRVPSQSPSTSSTPEQTVLQEASSPVMPTSLANKPMKKKVNVTLMTSKGTIRLELDGTRAPLTVGNFVTLTQRGMYNGLTFHRVIPDFMIQGGDPLSKDVSQRARHGTGGPGYTFQDEINSERIVRGTVAMANAGPNTNGSQFFIVTAAATPHLDGKHTNFGKVISGMDVVDAISRVARDENDNPLQPVVIESVTVENPQT